MRDVSFRAFWDLSLRVPSFLMSDPVEPPPAEQPVGVEPPPAAVPEAVPPKTDDEKD